MVGATLSSIGIAIEPAVIKIITKPIRKVLTEKDYAKGELAMPFDNAKIVSIDKSKKPPANTEATGQHGSPTRENIEANAKPISQLVTRQPRPLLRNRKRSARSGSPSW